ncbi:MMS19 nucleotide excision repair protein homolog [Lucilia sericata]|uniref:MMS19 nucleotide excision repair protein homolog n=1 Tax=Lucilia sericata TaxID=13632 RepID=UPI0018A80695|nr:MMS19 nucleotide excision repair protein homolog [Lucilia sericata]
MVPLTQVSLEEAIKSDKSLKNAAEQIAKDIQNKSYEIVNLCEQLNFALTSSNVEQRVQGTWLFSRVLANLPKDQLNAEQCEVLANFYAARLKDHHNVIPAIIEGIDALIHMKMFPGKGVVVILQSFFLHTTCQSQLRSDRYRLFTIFKFISETFVEELKAMSGDFIYGIISSIDGERDPRNLDFIYSFMPDFIATYPLLHLSEEMFEIFACYFPIDFNPSKNDPDTITRENLSNKLTKCLVASVDFVEWCVTLALEKLESELIVAKCDSLELLYQAALKFPCESLEEHFEQIWTALKSEVFPGSDNKDVVALALRALRCILEQATAEAKTTISHNYQTMILGTILTHLSDVKHRLFNPASLIALVCVAGDPVFASEKILNTFLLKLQEPSATEDDEQFIRIFNIIEQLFCIVTAKGETVIKAVNSQVCAQLHALAIQKLRSFETCTKEKVNQDLLKAAIGVLIESAPIINEANRALVYKVLMQLLTHDSIDLEQTQTLLERLGALQPIELQSNCIDGCINNFANYNNFVKEKVLSNLLPLIRQMAFTERIMDLLYKQSFGDETISNDVRLLALKALNKLLQNEDERFIEDLQHNSELISKLVHLAQNNKQLDSQVLAEISQSLSLIIRTLAVSEQFMVATEYLYSLNLQLTADLYIAKGLLGFLNKDISLDDHFERLMDDLTQLSLMSEDEHVREVAHHLMCSLVNKIDYTEHNRGIVRRIITSLKEAIRKENKKAVEALSWLARGLVVRGSDDAAEIVEALAELLDHASLAGAATLAFDIISAEYPQLHLPVVKFLFKQKFFHLILNKLGHKLETYCEHHLTAFIYVIKTTPHAVLKMNLEKIGPIIFKCLDSSNAHTLCIALKICENFIKQQDEYYRGHLNHLIPACLKLSKFNNAMQVRVLSLNLLYDITKYPTFVLLPYKMDVVLDLASALDDPKRLVRNAAVQARNAWYLVGAPNSS